MTANSYSLSGKDNRVSYGFILFIRSTEDESFSGVEVAGESDIDLGDVGERGTFLEILEQEAVGILDRAILPRVVGAREKAVGVEGGRAVWVWGELAAVVEGDCFDDVPGELQQGYDGRSS